MKFKLVAREDQESGVIGWIRKDANRDIYGPLGVDYYGLAHDLLEHVAMENVGDEMVAHGVLYHLRGPETGWCSKYGNVVNAKNIGEGDWIPLFQAVANEGGYIPPIEKQAKIQDSGVEEDIAETIRVGTNAIRKEWKHLDEDGNYTLSDLERDLAKITSVYADFFRKGYRFAKRRYRNCPDRAHLFNTTFEALARHKPEFEYQELEIKIDIKKCVVRVDIVHDEEYG